MALRELLALFDVQIRGGDKLGRLDAMLDNVEQGARTTDAAFKQLGTVFTNTFRNVDGGKLVQTLGVSETEARKLLDTFNNIKGAKLDDFLRGRSTAELKRINVEAERLRLSMDLTGDEARGVATAMAQLRMPPRVPKDINASTAALTRLRGVLGGVGRFLGRLGVSFAGLFAITRIKSAVTETLNLADAVGKLSKSTGLTTDSVQVYQEFIREAGGDARQLVQVTGQLSQRLIDASNGSLESVRTFKQLGVEYRNAAGGLRTMDEVLPDVLAGLADTENAAERLGLAGKLLGTRNSKLVAGLDQGSDALREQIKLFQETAVVFSRDFITKAQDANDEISLMSRQFDGAKAVLIGTFLPAIRVAVNWFGRIASGVQRASDEMGGFGRLLKSLTVVGALLARGPLLSAFRFLLPLLRVAAGAAAKFLIPLLAIDDIIGFLSGDASLLGKALDSVFGDGAAAEFLETLRTIGRVTIAVGVAFGQWALENILQKFNEISAEVSGFFAFLSRDINEAISEFQVWFDSVFENIFGIENAFEKVWNFVGDLFGSIWDGIVSQISSIPKLLSSAFPSLGDLFSRVNSAAQGALNNTVSPTAAAGASVVLRDQRNITIDASGATPGVIPQLTNRVERTLNADRTATLNAVSRN